MSMVAFILWQDNLFGFLVLQNLDDFQTFLIFGRIGFMLKKIMTLCEMKWDCHSFLNQLGNVLSFDHGHWSLA